MRNGKLKGGKRMYNVLIADDNVEFSRSVINCLTTTNENVRFANISKDGQETIQAIARGNVDIVLLDMKMPKSDGIKILNKIREMDIYPLPTIIVVSAEEKYIEKIRNNPMVAFYINKGIGFTEMITTLNKIINEKHISEICLKNDERIREELMILGFNMKHNGSNYLLEAIRLVMRCRNGEFTDNLEKNIYPIVGRKHNKSVCTIKSNILKAIDYMYRNSEEETLKEYFHFDYYIKPTPKMIIATILNKI